MDHNWPIMWKGDNLNETQNGLTTTTTTITTTAAAAAAAAAPPFPIASGVT